FGATGAFAQHMGPEPGEATDVLGEVGEGPLGTRRDACIGFGVAEGGDHRLRASFRGVDVLGVVHGRIVRQTDARQASRWSGSQGDARPARRSRARGTWSRSARSGVTSP